MRIRFDYPKGAEGWSRDAEMVTVPRIGESVLFDGDDEHYVRHVMHTPGDTDHDVYVVLEVHERVTWDGDPKP